VVTAVCSASVLRSLGQTSAGTRMSDDGQATKLAGAEPCGRQPRRLRSAIVACEDRSAPVRKAGRDRARPRWQAR
jgi:hypothetical protein